MKNGKKFGLMNSTSWKNEFWSHEIRPPDPEPTLGVCLLNLLYKCPEEHRFQAAGNERKKERILIEIMKERKKERKRERKKERREKERKKNPGKLPGRSTTSI